MVAHIDTVSDKTFDYVICGGGTAGLSLAVRLSEDSSVSVAVLEAGEANMNDPNTLMPAQYGTLVGNPKYDWGFVSTKQKHSNGAVVACTRGKGLGGTSAINYYAWVKPTAADMNALEKLGNPGWNWIEFKRLSERVETFTPADAEHSADCPHTYSPENRGRTGPIQTTVPHHVKGVDDLYQEILTTKGLDIIKDPYGGDITGSWSCATNVDPKTWTRSNALTAYYMPNQARKNLTVLTEALVTRALFTHAQDPSKHTAVGAEFFHDGKKHVVHARKEVILSAGSVIPY